MKFGFRKKLALNLHETRRKNEVRLHELTYLFWECTLRCNLSCLHCGSDCMKHSYAPDMPKEDFLKVIDEIEKEVNPNKTMIAITGGEPLLRKDLEEVGKELKKRGFPWGVVTNGYLLNEIRLGSLLRSGLKSMTISLDGFEESHDWFRNFKGSFAKAEHAVKLLVQTNVITFDVATCANSRNIDELPAFYEYLKEIGVKYWRIFTVFPRGRAVANAEIMPNKQLLEKLFEFIKEKRAEGAMKINYGCESFLGEYEGEVRDYFFFCKAGINIGSILVDGSISACPSLRGDFIQGNIYKDSFMDVWENGYKQMRDRSWTKTGDCADCDCYKWCHGGALHLRDGISGELLFCQKNELEKS